MLARHTIGTKLSVGFTILALLCGAVGTVGVYSLRQVNAAAREIGTNNLPSLRGIMMMNLGLADMQRLELAAVQARTAKNDAAFTTALIDFDAAVKSELEAGRALYEPLPRGAAEDVAWKALVAASDAFAQHTMTTRAHLEAGQLDGIADEIEQGRALFVAATAKADSLVDMTEGFAQGAVAHAAGLVTKGTNITLAIALMAVALATYIGWALTRDITQPLQLVMGRLTSLANHCIKDLGLGLAAMSHGDLTVEAHPVTKKLHFTRGDELGTLGDTIDTMLDRAVATIGSFSATQHVLREVIDEGAQLNAQALQGHLSARGNAQRFEGVYRDLVQGTNAILDAVTTPIAEASSVLDQLAARDLQARVEGDYAGDHARIKTAINHAVDNLEAAFVRIVASGDEVQTSSQAIADGSQSLASGAAEQAAAIEEISSSLQEVSSSARNASSVAAEARALSAGADDAMVKGSAGVEALQTAMAQIQESSKATAAIVKTIDAIAFQTNLLALNAAVEAARAGDAGRGFAVVAEEVRALAIRAADAAKDTSALIDVSAASATTGAGATEQVVESITDVRQRVNRVTALMEQIAQAAEQQRQGIEQVNVAVSQMNGGTQAAAANAEESAAAAESLAAQSRQLQEVVREFRLSDARRAAPSVRTPARLRPVAHTVGSGSGHRNSWR